MSFNNKTTQNTRDEFEDNKENRCGRFHEKQHSRI